MIENLRKYTGLIIVVIVILLIGFIFMGTSSMFRQSSLSGGTFVTVDGRGYTQPEFIRLGSAPMKLVSDLRAFDYRRMTPNDLEVMQFSNLLSSNAETREAATMQFFASRMVIQDARNQFGVHPSDEVIGEFVKGLSAFQTPPPVGAPPGTTGSFDQAAYNHFIKKRLDGYGISERGFQDIIRDLIATTKLRNIIGSGLSGDRNIATSLVVVNAQQIEAAVSKIDLASFRDAVKPSDEELKAYWEISKDAYMTEKRIKVSYFIATPVYPEELKEEKPDAPAAADAAATPEKTEVEKTAEAEAKEKRATERAKLDKALAIDVDTFVNQFSDSEGKDFDTLVESNEWMLVATDWFTRTTCPEELKISPRATSTGKSVIDYLFELTTGPDALAPFSTAIAVGDSQWLLARLDELEEPRVKTFEEAEPLVREHYVKEKSDAALKKEVDDKLAAIKEALAADKPYTEAAEAAGLKVSELGPFAATDTLDEGFIARELFAAAATTNPGELAEPQFNANGALLIFVTARQIVKDDNRGQQIDNYVSSLSNQFETTTFSAWLKDRLEQAKITGPEGL